MDRAYDHGGDIRFHASSGFRRSPRLTGRRAPPASSRRMPPGRPPNSRARLPISTSCGI